MATQKIRRTLDPGFQSSAITYQPSKIDAFGRSSTQVFHTGLRLSAVRFEKRSRMVAFMRNL
jgi:hypothetical protein